MNKLGSEFINDFEKNEKKLFGLTYRTLLLIFSVISLIILIVVVNYFNLDEIIYELYSVFLIPVVAYGLEIDKRINLKGRLHFLFLEKKRIYKTELENKEKGEK